MAKFDQKTSKIIGNSIESFGETVTGKLIEIFFNQWLAKRKMPSSFLFIFTDMVERLKAVKNQMTSDGESAAELMSKSKEEVKAEIIDHITHLNEAIMSTNRAKLTTGTILKLFLLLTPF